ncbi:ABC transporter substrate-binding protein [Microvirga thermotolerans]|uniref:ABC transporter substrate-binding protein n=1 Tax=Microvirga thermotolerans TaxID=2651334 RepID=A0A5P9JU30_9HYPH|nr:ABC transporter substrate-binding protein [Microvirga thermotolerans]QFU15136.1 ABC transporter substrate-binding protein [Microvirga thermotolerans]
MKLNSKLGGMVAAALLAGTMLGGAASAQTLTMGLRAGPDSIDPHWSTLGSQAEALRHIFDTIVMADENLQLKPGLATSWKPVDDTTWEFKIREGVKFHDGSELTAEDVKFSIDRIPVVTGPMSMTIYTKQVKETKVVDKYTLHVITKAPAPTLPNDFIRLFVVPKSIGMEARNEQFNSGKAAIGTGPYKFVSWEPKGDLVLERFDGYWGQKPHWQKVIRKEIPNDPARMAALKSGQVDLVNYVPATDYAAMQKDKSVDTFIADTVYFFNITPNVKETLPKPVKVDGKEIAENPLRDARVREALDLAIDRKTLVRVVLEGLGKPANQLMPASFFGGNKNLPERPYNVAKAKELLAAAGYPKGFEIDFFCTNNRLPGDAAVCEALSQMWARAGLKVNANALNGTVFFPAQQKGEFPLWMSGWGTLTGEASYTYGSLVHTADPKTGLGAFNKQGYSNPEVDALLQEGARTMDDAKRRALFEKVTEISMNDRALIPTVQLQTVWAAKKGTMVIPPRVDQETLAYEIKPKS